MNYDVEYKCESYDDNLLLKEILHHRLKISSHLMRKLKVQGGIFLNGEICNVRRRVKEGDTVNLLYPKEESYFEPQDIPIDVVYEDDDLLIINKQAGLIVHPTYNFPDGTLINAVVYRMNVMNQTYKPRFVNRLDMWTSGLIIVAKNAHCQDFLSRQMQENKVDKRYIALVHGITDPKGTIDSPILRDPNHKARRMVHEDGYPSITHYKRLRAFNVPNSGQIEGYSLVGLKLDTGRTHQIRVHMTHIGHPLVGDELYAQLYGYSENPDWMPRQALHAKSLAFIHPTTGKEVQFEANIPEDLQNAVLKLSEMGV